MSLRDVLARLNAAIVNTPPGEERDLLIERKQTVCANKRECVKARLADARQALDEKETKWPSKS